MMVAMRPRPAFLLSLPERLVRTLSAVVGGAAHETAELVLPRLVRRSRLYEATAKNLLRILTELAGGVAPRYEIAEEVEPDPRRLLLRKTAGNAVELGSILAFGFSPLWLLAGAADVTHGSRTYLDALTRELIREGVLRADADVSLGRRPARCPARDVGHGCAAHRHPPARARRAPADARGSPRQRCEPSTWRRSRPLVRSAGRCRPTRAPAAARGGPGCRARVLQLRTPRGATARARRVHRGSAAGRDGGLRWLRTAGLTTVRRRGHATFRSGAGDAHRAWRREAARRTLSGAAQASFDEACTHDRAGREAEAIPCYETALAEGLSDPERPRALLGLGSSLRNVGRHDDAVAVLRGAVADYPRHAALRFFLALALRSAGHEQEAFRTLGEIVGDEAGLDGYDRAVAYYLEHLD